MLEAMHVWTLASEDQVFQSRGRLPNWIEKLATAIEGDALIVHREFTEGMKLWTRGQGREGVSLGLIGQLKVQRHKKTCAWDGE